MTAMLRWWAIFCSIIISSLIVNHLGLFHTLWIDDLSKLSFITLSVFSLLTIFVGNLTFLIHKQEKLHYKKYLPACWFGAEALMGMGMMGTLLGFIMMFQSNVSHIDFSNVETAKAILAQLTKGTTTAVVTTFVGLLTSLLLKVQLVNLEADLDDVFRE